MEAQRVLGVGAWHDDCGISDAMSQHLLVAESRTCAVLACDMGSGGAPTGRPGWDTSHPYLAAHGKLTFAVRERSEKAAGWPPRLLTASSADVVPTAMNDQLCLRRRARAQPESLRPGGTGAVRTAYLEGPVLRGGARRIRPHVGIHHR